MYPYVRAATAVARGWREPEMNPMAPMVTRHRAWPTDTDMFGELNHGRIITLFELARWRYAARCGMVRLVLRDRCVFAVAGLSIRYRHRIPFWSRYEMRTAMLGWDDRFIYMDQSMWMGARACHQMLLRIAVLRRREVQPPGEVAERLGMASESPALPDWVTNWIAAEGTRPWPPA